MRGGSPTQARWCTDRPELVCAAWSMVRLRADSLKLSALSRPRWASPDIAKPSTTAFDDVDSLLDLSSHPRVDLGRFFQNWHSDFCLRAEIHQVVEGLRLLRVTESACRAVESDNVGRSCTIRVD